MKIHNTTFENGECIKKTYDAVELKHHFYIKSLDRNIFKNNILKIKCIEFYPHMMTFEIWHIDEADDTQIRSLYYAELKEYLRYVDAQIKSYEKLYSNIKDQIND